MRVLLLSEGNTDVTLATPDVCEGAARVFLRRLLEEAIGRQLSEWEIDGGRLPRLHRGHGFREKVCLAIAIHSRKDDVRSLVILIDRDGPANSDRVRLLEGGRADAEEEGYRLALNTAVGVAVEMLEAWLLADAGALEAVVQASGAAPDPESCLNPKSRLKRLIEHAQISPRDAYDRLAAQAELRLVKQRCHAFERFDKEVRQRVVTATAS